MSSTKPITLYTHGGTPNPWKVVIVLEELSIPYTTVEQDVSTVKQAPYTDINPNGRLPAIQDPNTGITLWESGAIIEYLVSEYDKEGKLHYSQSPEKYLTQQWLHFQMSGQGPYFGQAAWFMVYHPEKLPTAIDRYKKEIQRVIGVLDGWLASREWLVGDKCTYADLAFVTWSQNVPFLLKDDVDLESQFPAYSGWLKKLEARPAVQKASAEKAKASAVAKH